MSDLWRKEFGDGYAVPDEVGAAGLVDISWHNDAAPSFVTLEYPDTRPARLWVDHPDPAQREVETAAGRFAVTVDDTDEVHYEGNDVAEAIRVLRRVAGEHQREADE